MQLFGFHRAEVIDPNDPEEFGRVKLWIPDIMPNIERTSGIWARPANNPFGGYNDEANATEQHYAGSTFIPKKGSWLWVFFEQGNINRPYYWNPLQLEKVKTLPENRVGGDPTNKWVLIKSGDGKTIVVSDDPDDARVEITGKKRKITDPPAGDTASVYEIDENQTVILIDERENKEKILLRTHKGDFLHIDVDEQTLQAYFKNGMYFKSDEKITFECKSFHVKASDNINEEAGKDINNKAGSNFNAEGGTNANVKGGATTNIESSGNANIKASGQMNVDGSFLSMQQGSAGPASSAEPSSPETPEGERDT